MKALLVFAHPSDESFSVGGTVALLAKEKWNIDLVCAASGDSDPIGQKELQHAAGILGIKNVTFLDFSRDKLKGLSPGTLEDPIHAKMMEFLPDVVVTFDTTGGDNDPDHIKLCYATTYAFQKYAAYLYQLKNPQNPLKGRGQLWLEEEYTRTFSDTNGANDEPKLYYSVTPESVVQFLLKAKNIDPEPFGKPVKGIDDKFITTVVDIDDVKVTKGKALLCYDSQKDAVERYIDLTNHPNHRQEYFVLRMQGIWEVFMGKTDRVTAAL